MKDWEMSVPYRLPRIISLRRCRSNTLPIKLPKPNLRTVVPLGDVNARWTSWRRSDYFYPEMIPEPDYSESEEEEESPSEDESSSSEEERSMASGERLRDVQEENEKEEDNRKRRVHLPSKLDALAKVKSETAPRMRKSLSLEEGLIMPKKPSNPYLESTERKKLHKELKFKQKYGKNVVNPRSELQMALEKYTESKVKRDTAASRRTSLEKILEQQARKIELQERAGIVDEAPDWIERLQRQHVPRLSDPKTEEFYRVHARVVSNLMSSFSPMDEGGIHSSAESSSRGHESSAHSESDG